DVDTVPTLHVPRTPLKLRTLSLPKQTESLPLYHLNSAAYENSFLNDLEPTLHCTLQAFVTTLVLSVAPECITAFNELKLGKASKYIIYKLSDDYTEIVVEEKGTDPNWSVFRQKLLDAKSKSMQGTEGPGPRYAVYDFEYELANGEGKRNKIAFISWSPDDATSKPKTAYSSSKESLKNALNGIGEDLQVNDEGDLEYDDIMKRVRKGGR
ncbi:MAG: cofilin, partial [Candelina submexicana]